MADIIVLTMAGTNLLTVVTPLEGSIKRQATILGMACMNLVQQYLTGISSLQTPNEPPLTITVKAAAIYATEIMGGLIAYCEDNYAKDAYLIKTIDDNLGATHHVPIVIQRRPVYLHNLPADFNPDDQTSPTEQ